MAAYRYWCARGLAPRGSGANLALTELQLLDGLGARVDVGAALSATVAPAGGALATLGDGLASGPAVWWQASQIGDLALVWDLGAGNAAAVAAIRLGSSTPADVAPARLLLLASEDGQAWAPALNVPNIDYPGDNALGDATPGEAVTVAALPALVSVRGASVADPNVVAVALLPALGGIDTDHAGRGRIVGTVMVAADPVNLPVARTVYLLTDPLSRVVAETVSDDVTGEYRFDDLNEQRRYTVVSFDPTHDKRAVIADNLAPEVGPEVGGSPA
jgi:hypothetical protein